ncbi:hypothetical protein Poli38472_005782 [Pythium oligandrum]|uniref:Apoptosis regulatory protein Siva n=1 Tax=Pythium oligandrum TaxID=41045 RepID=A0A8K1CS99_PYTOL|nr:hypothetical protein Poli38472_005782 [Pythium oligandrum]|eukprot:TMW68314.1 hypothetical protein Poli38472_005782 [Pythium oligandrum]
MKRQRQEEPVCVGHGNGSSFHSPVRGMMTSTTHASPFWTRPAQHEEVHITPIKRQRDRSVPMDALSRLMTAAQSAARGKKRAQLTLTGLFGGRPAAPVEMACCSVCVTTTTQSQRMLPSTQIKRCTHCERSMGPCCERECSGCSQVFCANCSTINCDQQFDRVFCLSCQYDRR